ncbi:MAG: patatin-like phospholipase family protein [Rhodospirillaceae bacterium]|nr:patatin-like phospholipase family protein [Rhodospirillaceae bacterium]
MRLPVVFYLRFAALGGVVAIQLLASGCSAPSRLDAVPQAQTVQAEIPGIPNARFWPDDPDSIQEMIDTAYASIQAEQAAGAVVDANGNLPPVAFLAVSGGGDDGAFGAGLLTGWTEHGTRPEFKLVTGVSTGALTAPFAYLGSDYDDELRAVYTKISAADIYEERGLLAALFDDALSDTTPLQRTVAKHVTDELVRAIAAAYAKGRFLLISSTDLDSRRPVIWNIGAIASVGSPAAVDLIRKILVASAAVPGAFPPVMIEVEIDGQTYQEMHVDGGAVSQAFIYPPQLNVAAVSAEYGIQRERSAYIIRNARLDPDWASTERQTMSIAGRAISTLIQSQGIGDLYRMYLETGRDGVDYNLAFIGPEFDTPGGGDFDPVYMGALFDYGFALGKAGYPWHKSPPGFE